MIRLYNDRGLAARNWVSAGVLVVAVIWGIVEIVRAKIGASDTTGFLFGVGFLAAAAYGAYRLTAEARDTIIRFEADFGNGQSVVTLWQPWGLRRLVAPLAELKGWRMYVAVKSRTQRTYLLRVNHPANPRPLQIALMPGKTDMDGLRRLAPEAIEDFETNIGKRRST